MTQCNIFRHFSVTLIMLLSTGCSQLDVYQGKAVKVEGDIYYYNEMGEIEMTESQLDKYEAAGNIVRIKHIAPSSALIVDPEELAVLMQDEQLFFTLMDGTKLKYDISALVEKGSLHENIDRIVTDNGWNPVNWQAKHDYFIDKPFGVVGGDVQALIMEVVSGFPVFVKFEEGAKKIVVN